MLKSCDEDDDASRDLGAKGRARVSNKIVDDLSAGLTRG